MDIAKLLLGQVLPVALLIEHWAAQIELNSKLVYVNATTAAKILFIF